LTLRLQAEIPETHRPL